MPADLVWTRKAPRRFGFYFKREWMNKQRTASHVNVVLYIPTVPMGRGGRRVDWAGPITLPKEAT